MLRITSSKLTGSPDSSGWSQIHDFKPDDADKLKKRGHLVAVISMSRQPEGVDSVITGREVLSRLHEEYYGNMDEGAFLCLKHSLRRVANEFSEYSRDISIGAVAILEDICYCVSSGTNILLFRGSSLVKILKGGEKIISASGHVQKEDILLITSDKFRKLFSEGVVKASLSAKDTDSFVEQLAPSLHSQERVGDVAVAAIYVEEESEDGEEGVFSESGKPQEEVEKPTFRKDVSPEPQIKIQEFQEKRRGMSLLSLAKSLSGKLTKSGVVEASAGSEKRKKVSITVGVLLVLLLLVSIGFGIKQKKEKDYRKGYQEDLQKASHQLGEALTLVEVNPVRARELFVSSKEGVEKLVEGGIVDEDLDLLRQKIEDNQGVVLGEYRQEPSLFIDLSLLSSGFVGSDISTYDTRLYVLNEKGARVVSVSMEDKRSEVVAGPSRLKDAKQIAVYSNNIYVLQKDGIHRTDDGKRVIEGDWEGDILVSSFAGNIYVLDKVASQIWRYAGVDGVFSSRKAWLASGVDVNLTTASEWVIDGSIWLLADNQILRFNSGNKTSFSVSGVFPPIDRIDAIYTDEESEGLYLLEKDKGRLVVVSKDGDYLAQYISDNLKEIDDFVVSESYKKVILMVGDKLFEIELEHIK